jgi:hypothetical protein
MEYAHRNTLVGNVAYLERRRCVEPVFHMTKRSLYIHPLQSFTQRFTSFNTPSLLLFPFYLYTRHLSFMMLHVLSVPTFSFSLPYLFQYSNSYDVVSFPLGV